MARRKNKSKNYNRAPKRNLNNRSISHRPSSKEARSNRKKAALRRKYKRRRIILVIILIALLFLIVRIISKAVNSYKVSGYPDFRDQVLYDMANEVFISSSEGRSLSTAEKVTDFDNMYKTIERNYAVDKYNKENFKNFEEEYNSYRKKVYSSKTDQEYFKLLNQYLSLMEDPRTFILDKNTYDHIFEHYRKDNKDYRNKILGDPQVVDRYKRLIADSKQRKSSMNAAIEKEGTLRINLEDFKPDEFEKDLDKIVDLLLSNPPTSKVILDLSNNNSIDDTYPIKLAEVLIHEDFEQSGLIFYRGDLLKNNLNNIKKNENQPYSTPFIKNDPNKYPKDTEDIDLNDYMYYDQINLKIEKNKDFSNRDIYILTNSQTGNQAIKLADILKNSGAKVIKNGLDTNPTRNDVVYDMRTSLYIMEHSGLILSLNTSFSSNEDGQGRKYLEYDQLINSQNPIQSVYDFISE